jgi:hypothetical protein
MNQDCVASPLSKIGEASAGFEIPESQADASVQLSVLQPTFRHIRENQPIL